MKLLKNFLNRILSRLIQKINEGNRQSFDEIKLQLGKLNIKVNSNVDSQSLKDYEFKVFSQWGDDGIIQYLVKNLPSINRRFIEFGVENYLESNTRFLLINDNWKGLVIDGSENYVNYIKNDKIYRQFDLTVISNFITAENINLIISKNGFEGEIGLLHVDIDGNDYWVWKAITVCQPTILIMEYNCLLGIEKGLTIPYSPSFVRSKAHHSMLYAGASLKVIYDLAKTKNYTFLGCNSAGNNAYFIHNSKAQNFTEVSLENGYVYSSFRESRDENGIQTFIGGAHRKKLLTGMEFYNTSTHKTEIFTNES